MSNRTIEMTDQLYTYLLDVSLREEPVLARLREETAQMAEKAHADIPGTRAVHGHARPINPAQNAVLK